MGSIGVLGSGRVATALATKLAAAGHDVTIGSRDVAATAPAWKEAGVAVAEPAEAAGGAALVVNATPGDSSVERLGALHAELAGKVLLDVANATERTSNGMPGGLSYPNSSLAEQLQAALPDTKVVKALNTMLFTVMVDPQSLDTPPVAWLSGDDEEAKATVGGLLGDLGWPPEWIEDLGGIATARGPEAVMLLVPSIMRKRGMVPFAFTIAQ